jgi:hypothetical protein
MLCSYFIVKRLCRVELLPSISIITKRFFLLRAGEILWQQDIRREDLISISEFLGQPYLSETKDEPKFPVSGLIHSANGRRCVNLVVERGNKKLYVPFIITSGSPVNVISEDTLKALGVSEFTPQQLNVTLHGFKGVTCNYGANDPKLKNVNLLGHQFFAITKVHEFFNVDSMELTLHKSMTDFLKSVTKLK